MIGRISEPETYRSPQVGWASSDGSTLEPWWGYDPLHQVGIDRVVDT